KTSIFSHPVYLFLRKFSLQDSRGGSNSGNPWIKVTGRVDNNSLMTDMTNLRIALYQGNNTSTRLTLGEGSGSGYRVTAGLDTTTSTFTFMSVLFRNGDLNGGAFSATASMSMIYN
ncbi:hypothetical protein RNN12_23775, partial [Escherichia coli]|nr:hypothetical protein [Escherichia coli]